MFEKQEEAQFAAGAIPGLLAEPAPVVRLIPGFGDSALSFTLTCYVAEFVDQFPVHVTRHPTAEWVVQQLREAFPEAGPYRYAILDHDSNQWK